MTKKEMLKDLQKRAREYAEQEERLSEMSKDNKNNRLYHEGRQTAFELMERLLKNYEFMLG